jgi:hypothetical protein
MLPGAVHDNEGGADSEAGGKGPARRARGPKFAAAADDGSGEGDAAGDGAGGEAASASEAASGAEGSTTTGSTGGGDFARGKRLRKLLRALNSYATVRTMNVFRLRMILLSGGVLLLHVVAFVAALATISAGESHTHENDATGGRAGRLAGGTDAQRQLLGVCHHSTAAPLAIRRSQLNPHGSAPKPPGTLMRLLHQSCSYARVIEAAQRDYGYSAEDMVPYGNLLAAHMDKCAGRAWQGGLPPGPRGPAALSCRSQTRDHAPPRPRPSLMGSPATPPLPTPGWRCSTRGCTWASKGCAPSPTPRCTRCGTTPASPRATLRSTPPARTERTASSASAPS